MYESKKKIIENKFLFNCHIFIVYIATAKEVIFVFTILYIIDFVYLHLLQTIKDYWLISIDMWSLSLFSWQRCCIDKYSTKWSVK